MKNNPAHTGLFLILKTLCYLLGFRTNYTRRFGLLDDQYHFEGAVVRRYGAVGGPHALLQVVGIVHS